MIPPYHDVADTSAGHGAQTAVNTSEPRPVITDYPWALGMAVYVLGAGVLLIWFAGGRMRLGSLIGNGRPAD